MVTSGFRSTGGKQESGIKSFKGETEIQDFWQSYNQNHWDQH